MAMMTANSTSTKQAMKQPCRSNLCRLLYDSHQPGGAILQQGSQDQSHPQILRFCFPAPAPSCPRGKDC